MNHNTIISLENISKSYFGRSILKDLNARIDSGTFTVLLGKNGSGKSTLMRLISGVESVDSGNIEVFGKNIESEDLARRQRMAYISEQIALEPASTLKRALDIHRSLQPKWDQALFERFFKIFGLSLEQKFMSLSRGQKIQFLFSLATGGRPDLYLLDEVTSVLDANARFQVMNFLKAEVDRGANVVLATNIALETHNFANHIVILLNGNVGLNCTAEELQEKFVKFRVTPNGNTNGTIPTKAKPVQLNGDGSVSYLIEKTTEATIQSDQRDLRGVTVEDVFIYFTGPELS